MGGPGFGDESEPDAELSAEAEAGDGAVGEEVPVAAGKGAKAREDTEEQDSPGEHADAAETVAQHAKADAPDDGAEEGAGHERGGARGGDVERGRDRCDEEDEKEEIKAFYAVADGGGSHGELGLLVGAGTVDGVSRRQCDSL